MPRIPNTNDANGVWDLNQQRNAAYGQVWPLTYVPVPAWSGDRYFSYNGLVQVEVVAIRYVMNIKTAQPWHMLG